MPLPRPAPITAPGPTGAAMLRAVHRIRHDPLAFLLASRERYGAVVQFPIPVPPTYLISDPEAVRRVLVANAAGYGKDTMQYRALATVTGEGLLAADTEVWRRRRPIVQPAFHRSAVALFAGHAAAAVTRLQQRWDPLAARGEVVDVEVEMAHLALDVIGRGLFGADLTGGRGALATATGDALDVVVRRASSVPLPGWLPTPGRRRFDAALRVLDAAVDRLVAQRRARPGGDAQPQDLLGLLLASNLDRGQVRDEIVTFVVAGHETVASALTWAWDTLARHPHVLAQLRAEADAGWPVAAAPEPTGLVFARAVVDEVLRVYPPVWLITRRSLAPDLLAGVEIPASALIIVSPWLLHRDPACWEQPDRFRPERFLGSAGARAARTSAYLPFGAGPRLCIGREAALLEAVVSLAGLARRYDICPTRPVPPRPLARVTVRPEGGLPARLARRA